MIGPGGGHYVARAVGHRRPNRLYIYFIPEQSLRLPVEIWSTNHDNNYGSCLTKVRNASRTRDSPIPTVASVGRQTPARASFLDDRPSRRSWPATSTSSKLAQPTFNEAYGQQPPNPTKGSWLARVSHRASHIPNRPSGAPPFGSKESLPLRAPGSAGLPAHEQFAAAKKTQSYPASPTGGFDSPAETEFAPTPIDASFGERLDPPPDRPLPERPQRSRSGTATQADLARRPLEDKMDTYTRQAVETTYDSDGEADDEYERSVIASPNGAGHSEDDISEHSYDSGDDHDSVEGADTPTTQGWAEREGRSPGGKISQWTEEEVADYIFSLAPSLKQYSQCFVEEGVNGEALIALHHDELRELGITSVGHRLTILKAVYEQKIRSGVKVEEGDYVPPSAEGEKGEMTVTQDDIARIIESIRLRDQRIIAAEAELRALRLDMERISEDNKKLRDETLPIMRYVKDQRTPLPDPPVGAMPSPRDMDPSKQSDNIANHSKGSSLSRKFSTKKLILGGAPKQASPTHAPQSYTPGTREVRDDNGAQLEASAAALAASNHLTASMSSQMSPNSVHGQQLSPTSPGYSMQSPSSAGLHPSAGSAPRSVPRDSSFSTRYDQRYGHGDDSGSHSQNTHWSQASTVVADQPSSRSHDKSSRGAPMPSPRDDEAPRSAKDGQRYVTSPFPRRKIVANTKQGQGQPTSRNLQKFPREHRRPLPSGSPSGKFLPLKSKGRSCSSHKSRIDTNPPISSLQALKRYSIVDDWRQYSLYIVHGDQERCLGLEEKPLLLFKQLDKEGRKPMFMLRRHASPQEGWSSSAGGGAGAGGGGAPGPSQEPAKVSCSPSPPWGPSCPMVFFFANMDMNFTANSWWCPMIENFLLVYCARDWSLISLYAVGITTSVPSRLCCNSI